MHLLVVIKTSSGNKNKNGVYKSSYVFEKGLSFLFMRRWTEVLLP